MNLVKAVSKYVDLFSDIFPRQSLLMRVQVAHPQVQQEDLPPPSGARSADDDAKYLPENIDPRIFLRFPDRIMKMDENIWFPDDFLTDPRYTKKKWDT